MKPLLVTDCVNLRSCTFIWYCLLCGKDKTLNAAIQMKTFRDFMFSALKSEILGLYIQFKLVTL